MADQNSNQKLYKKKIMDHYHNSRYRGSIVDADFSTDQVSPSCGDRLIFDIKCSNGFFTNLKFRGEGSILGQATASMLCEYAIGKSFEVISALAKDDVLEWLGVQLGPTRLRTVLFVLETLQKAIKNHAR